MDKFQIIHAWKKEGYRDGLNYVAQDGDERCIVMIYEDTDIVEYDYPGRREGEKFMSCSLTEFAAWADSRKAKDWKTHEKIQAERKSLHNQDNDRFFDLSDL